MAADKKEAKKDKKDKRLDTIEAKIRRNTENWKRHMHKYHDSGSDGTVRDGKTSILTAVLITLVFVAVSSAATYIFNIPAVDGTLGFRVDEDGVAEAQTLSVAGASTLAGAVTSGGNRTTVNTGTAAKSTVTVVEKGTDSHKQVVLTLDDVVLLIDGSSGAGWGTTNLYTFPEGRISIEGIVYENIILTPDGGDLAAGEGGDMAFGSAVMTNNNFTGVYEDFLASTSVDPIEGTNDAALAAETAHYDGTTTAIIFAMNWLVDDADVAAVSTNSVDGTITITYNWLGDY